MRSETVTTVVSAPREAVFSYLAVAFVVALLVMIGLICVFPDIAMWLPRIWG